MKELTRGQKIAKTNKERYGDNYYAFIGRLGGRKKKKKKKVFPFFSFGNKK